MEGIFGDLHPTGHETSIVSLEATKEEKVEPGVTTVEEVITERGHEGSVQVEHVGEQASPREAYSK